MTFNPSPKVAAARDFARRFKKPMVIIISFSAEGFEYASYGENQKLCTQAKRIGDYLFDSIKKYFAR